MSADSTKRGFRVLLPTSINRFGGFQCSGQRLQASCSVSQVLSQLEAIATAASQPGSFTIVLSNGGLWSSSIP